MSLTAKIPISMGTESIQSKGGKARALKMSSNERSKCASKAADARWNKNKDLDLELSVLHTIVNEFLKLDTEAQMRTADYLKKRFDPLFR